MSLKRKSGERKYRQFTNLSNNAIAKLKHMKKLCKNYFLEEARNERVIYYD